MKFDIVSRFFVPSIIRDSGADVAMAPRAYHGLIWAAAVVAGVILACGCSAADDPVAPDAGSPDVPELDAMPAPDASGDTPCTQECLSETSLRECTGGERIVECALGCVTAEARCGTLAPSNGVSTEHLLGVTGALSVPEDAQAIVDTSVGSITIGGESVRNPGVGVNNGIGFQYTADGLSVFAVQEFTMGARSNLRARGDKPLLILSAGDVEIAGTIDVSAGCDSDPSVKTCGGPGGGRGAENGIRATGCGIGGDGSFQSPPVSIGGGGGGGSDQAGAAGGDGGFGALGGFGGEACAPSLVSLRGGSGGGMSGSSLGGQGGGGGGAVQITSYTAIRLVSPAIIDAGGSGGTVGIPAYGGGGGGSGGGILLEAPVLSLDGALLAANGGGGGGGDDAAGEDGRRDVEQARGGDGAGGLGGSLAGSPTAGTLVGSGGGGGGGAGLIHLHAPLANFSLTDTVISPAPVRLDPQAE